MQNTENKKYRVRIIAILLIVIGILVFCFPKVTDYFYKVEVQKKKDSFQEQKGNSFEKLYEELQLQNQILYKEKQANLKDPFSYEQKNIHLEDYGLQDNIIGFIVIPKLEVELPILLGANSENMKLGAVHLTQTSYPIGGENTNSIIAAHRGYNKTEMFRNIQKLEIGDEIQIQNFKETLLYKVVETKVIMPNDIEALWIQNGKDLITLVTCHPYPTNKQRYIVICERI